MRRSAVAPIVLIIVFAVVCVIVAVQWSAYRADDVALHQERQLFAQAIAQRRAEILRDVESIVASDNAVDRLWSAFDWSPELPLRLVGRPRATAVGRGPA